MNCIGEDRHAHRGDPEFCERCGASLSDPVHFSPEEEVDRALSADEEIDEMELNDGR